MRAKFLEVPVTLRPNTTKGGRKVLRRSGKVPAVIYGRGLDNLLVTVDETVFTRTIPEAAWHTTPLQLVLQGAEGAARTYTAMVSEVQHNLVSRRLLSADFHVVSEEERVRAQVPVHPVGQHLAASKGGILEYLAHEISVEARPADIPPRLDVDISGLDLGDRVRVRDLVLPPGVKVLDSPDEVVLAVAAPAKAVEVAPAEAEAVVVAETAEPELVRPRREE